MSKKAEKGEGKKNKKKGKGSGDAAVGPSVAAHPRASYQVRRAKGWGGLIGFGLAAYVSYSAGVPMFDLGMRSLIAGIVGYMLAWACAVTIWRHLVLAELRAAIERGKTADPDMIPARAAHTNNSAPASNPGGPPVAEAAAAS